MADDYTLGDIVRLIDGLAESTQASFTRVENRLERIETRLDRIDDKLDRHEKRIEALETRP
jgi:chaperonin cofactor prefoldin